MFLFVLRALRKTAYSVDANLTLYAVWGYNVTYNANGGSGAPAVQVKMPNTSLQLSSVTPTWVDHTFLGWAITSSATTANYQAGASYTTNTPVTLYAVWGYTVTYNANGGSGAPAMQVKTPNASITLSSTIPIWSDHTFLGWSTSSSAITVSYQAGASYTSNNSIILYAVWGFNVTYNANGGSGTPSMQIKSPSGTLTLSTTIPTWSNHSFLGWATLSSSTYVSYKEGSSYTNNTPISLYAVWGYNVAYNANGGSGAPAMQVKTPSTPLTLSSTAPSWSGHTFLGWAADSFSTIASYTPGSTYNSNSSVTLYAVWKVITYIITYNANGGFGAPADQIKTYDVSLPLSYTVPTKTGFSFLGWATSSFATIASYQPGSYYSVNAGLALFAIWKAVTYTITFNANGGFGAPADQTKVYDENLMLSYTTPMRTGYTFQGWSTFLGSTIATYQAGGYYTNNAGATLYAVWKADTYIITYNANGGYSAPANQTKTYGDMTTLSYTIPIRSGYSFQGWATSSFATYAQYSAGALYTDNASITLYAVWK